MARKRKRRISSKRRELLRKVMKLAAELKKQGYDRSTALKLAWDEVKLKQILKQMGLQLEGYKMEIVRSENPPEVYWPTRRVYLGKDLWLIYWPEEY